MFQLSQSEWPAGARRAATFRRSALTRGTVVQSQRYNLLQPLSLSVPSVSSIGSSKFVKDESGATAIKYGLIAAASGLTLVAVMPTISSKLESTFGTISTHLD
jgi:pilus assembly protein Flp/PilA